MKVTTFFVAILSVTLIAFECAAQSPGDKAKGKAGTGQRKQRRDKAKGGPGQKSGSGQRDPGEMAARMMKEFDKDGDSKLSTRELTALLVAMQDRRSGKPAGGASKQRPGKAGKSKGKKKGKGEELPAGGQKPKRPGS